MALLESEWNEDEERYDHTPKEMLLTKSYINSKQVEFEAAKNEEDEVIPGSQLVKIHFGVTQENSDSEGEAYGTEDASKATILCSSDYDPAADATAIDVQRVFANNETGEVTIVVPYPKVLSHPDAYDPDSPVEAIGDGSWVEEADAHWFGFNGRNFKITKSQPSSCLLYTSDAADD